MKLIVVRVVLPSSFIYPEVCMYENEGHNNVGSCPRDLERTRSEKTV